MALRPIEQVTDIDTSGTITSSHANVSISSNSFVKRKGDIVFLNFVILTSANINAETQIAELSNDVKAKDRVYLTGFIYAVDGTKAIGLRIIGTAIQTSNALESGKTYMFGCSYITG